MSLVAWYPLNGDYKNYTGYDMNLTSSGTISYTDGKIGKALHTGGFKWTAEQTASILNNDELSIALWIYVKGETGSTSQKAMIFGNNSMTAPKNRKFSLFQYPDCNSLHWSWQNDVTDRTFTDGRVSNCLPSNEWTHICVTYKNPVGKIYINGELRHTFNGVSNSSTFAYETQVMHDSTYHCLNDYRFYNHCLSESEVKEISKAKILHYTMENPYGGSNLIRGGKLTNNQEAKNWTVYNLNNVTSQSITTDGWHIITPETGHSSNNGSGLNINFKNLGLTYGDTVTFSFEIKGEIGDNSNGGWFGWMTSNPTYTALYANIRRITYIKDTISKDYFTKYFRNFYY